jgi:hypothetical protein
MTFGFLGLALLGLAAWTDWRASIQRERDRYPGTAILGAGALCFRGQLVRWEGYGFRLDQATVRAGVLRIEYSTRAKNGWVSHTVRVPVPPRETDRAAELAARLG